MFKGTEVKPQLKRKPALVTDDEVPQQRQPKRAKQFTTTPAEMVTIFAQFAQATADGGHRRLNPVRTMETLVDRIMQSRPQHPPVGVNLEADTVNLEPEVQIVENPDGVQPAAAPAIQPVQAVGTLRANQNAATVPPRGGGGRGGDRGRGRGAQRGANNQGNQVMVPNDRPVRCSHLTATGTHCRVENFPEAMQCRGCNGRLQGQPQPLAPPQRWGGRGGSGYINLILCLAVTGLLSSCACQL